MDTRTTFVAWDAGINNWVAEESPYASFDFNATLLAFKEKPNKRAEYRFTADVTDPSNPRPLQIQLYENRAHRHPYKTIILKD